MAAEEVIKKLGGLSLDSTADELEALATRLSQQARDFRVAASAGDAGKAQEHRYEALDTAQGVVGLLKEPSTQWMDSLSSISLMTAIRIFQHWKAFDAIPVDGSSITYKDLSEKLGVQLSLLRRVAWMMVSMGVLKQEGEDKVSHTPRSLNYLDSEHGSDFHKTLFNHAFRAYGILPAYLTEYGNKEPEEQNHIPVTYAYGTPELTFWQHLEKNPDQIETFMRAIAPAVGRMPITGIYDFAWVVEKAKEPGQAGRILFVDVGGGTGHCIKAIHEENPGMPLTQFVLQDQYKIMEDLKTSPPESLRGVQMYGIDFNKEVPYKGGLIYWVRRVLHDYSDKLAINILKNVASAMADDSRILIAEDVSSNPPHFMTAMMDLMILTCAGKERTIEDFETIISGAGLKVLSVSQSKETPMAIIECVKA